MTDNSLALHASRVLFRSGAAGRRDRLVRNMAAWGVVGLIHLVFFLVLVISLHENAQRIGHRDAVETILDLTLMHSQNAPPVTLIKPDLQNPAAPDISTAPIVIIPPKLNPQEPAAAARPGDVLKAIGEALACGANNFEYLNQAQRDRCKRQPWVARKLANGTIVLEAAPRLDLAPPPMTGAEALRRRMQTAPPCPIIQNIPCTQTAPLFSLPTN